MDQYFVAVDERNDLVERKLEKLAFVDPMQSNLMHKLIFNLIKVQL